MFERVFEGGCWGFLFYFCMLDSGLSPWVVA